MHEPVVEPLPFKGFEELIYICDSSSLINIQDTGNLRDMRQFSTLHPRRIRIPEPVGKEIGRQSDELRTWWINNKPILITRFLKNEEHVLHERIAIKYAKTPFNKEGKTYPRVSDADVYALVTAIVRHWTLVTDDEGMKAVCRQSDHNASSLTSNQFVQILKRSSLEN